MAVKRFESLERKLLANPQLQTLYKEFMDEYLALGHMSIAPTPGHYFVPHHAIYKADDGDAKIRVVFDASARCSTGPSLNSCLLPGKKLQQDIIDVLTRFRIHQHAFTADICKMYRQIQVLPEYRKQQVQLQISRDFLLHTGSGHQTLDPATIRSMGARLPNIPVLK
eukprot:XP_008182034.1 PREDICTED: uncharacterized protein LOC103309132 [Acyrthosiphon pisum]